MRSIVTCTLWTKNWQVSRGSNIHVSSMRQSVSSPDATPRRELKIRHAAEYFWRTSRCFIWWWNTVSNAWYYVSNKMILEGKIKKSMQKWAVFHLISKLSLKTFISFMNYKWDWESKCLNVNVNVKSNSVFIIRVQGKAHS